MKNSYFLFLILLAGCSPTEDRVQSLSDKANHFHNQIVEKQYYLAKLNEQQEQLEQKILTLRDHVGEKNIRHILTLELSMSRFSLDVWDHVKDSMNGGKFDIPVDKAFYDSVKAGDSLADGFKAGSFLMRGSLGSFHIRVKGKRLQND